MQPVISVVTPVFNGERFLGEAIESVLSQTYENFELIIVDDGSTDETPAILDDYRRLDSRIVVKRKATNSGVVAALNLGCTLARGQYIARQDADDISLPTRFQRQIETFKSSPELSLIGSSCILIDERGVANNIMLAENSALVRWLLIFGNCIINSSVMLRKEVGVRYGFYRPGFDSAEDYELWSRISTSEKICNLIEPLVKYRVWDSSLSFTNNHQQTQLAEKISYAMFVRYLGFSISPEEARCLRNLRYGEGDLALVDIDKPRQLSKLLTHLYQVFYSSRNLSELERKAVARDIAEQFFKIASLAMKSSLIDAFLIASRGFCYAYIGRGQLKS